MHTTAKSHKTCCSLFAFRSRRLEAEKLAKQQHEEAEEAAESEHAKMLARRKASEEQHQKDVKSFKEMGEKQLSMQAKGHSMQAVPTDKEGVTGDAARKVCVPYHVPTLIFALMKWHLSLFPMCVGVRNWNHAS